MIKRTKVLIRISHYATSLLQITIPIGSQKSPQTDELNNIFKALQRVKWPYYISIRFMVLSPLENGPKFPKDFQGNQKSFFLSSKVKKYNPVLGKVFTVRLQLQNYQNYKIKYSEKIAN